jgi:hypothetical protein
VDFGERFKLELLILGDHHLLESEEIVAQEDLPEDLVVPLALEALNDALLQSFLGNSDFFQHTL